MFLLGHFAVFVERTGGNFWIYVVNLRKYLRFEGGKREDHNDQCLWRFWGKNES